MFNDNFEKFLMVFTVGIGLALGVPAAAILLLILIAVMASNPFVTLYFVTWIGIAAAIIFRANIRQKWNYYRA